jgi:adenylate cyclase
VTRQLLADDGTGAELGRRTTRRLGPAIVLANIGGALVVFVFLLYLLPLPSRPDLERQRWLNTLVFAAYTVGSIVLGRWWGEVAARPVLRWLASERPPTDDERAAVLRQPLRQMRINATIWLGAVVLFGLLNAPYDLVAAGDVATTIALGGFTTCAIAYLLAERLLRPVVTRAMAGTSEAPPVVFGVGSRLVLAWALGTGMPLLGLALGVWSPASDQPLGAAGVLFLVTVTLVIGLIAIGTAAGAVSDPIRSVADALRAVGEGRLDVTVPVYDASEVGQLQSGFNVMVRGLRERDRLRDLFGRQVGDDVARLALEEGVQLGGETREVAVLFVDIVGSTSLALSMDPQEVVQRLNAFFGVVIDVVTAYGGWVNKFEGDGALCVFGAPVTRPGFTTSALTAARILAERLAALPVEAAIGVSAGTVVAGHVGAETRFEYTVIGDPVNAAARLTELAKTAAGGVLADADVVAAAAPEEAACWVAGDQLTLRGRDRPTRLAHPAPTTR